MDRFANFVNVENLFFQNLVMSLRPRGSSGLHVHLTSTIENTRLFASSVNLQFHYFPLLIIFLVFCALLLDFAFYFIEGRFDQEFPTIEEMQTSCPNEEINSIFHAIAAYFMIFLLTLYISAACIIDYPNQILVFCSRFVSILCPIFQLFSAVINIGENATINFVLNMLNYGFLLVFFIFSIFLMKSAFHKYEVIFKFILVTLIFATFLAFCFTSNVFPKGWSSSGHLASHLSILVFSAIFIGFWIKDLSYFRLQIVILDE